MGVGCGSIGVEVDRGVMSSSLSSCIDSIAPPLPPPSNRPGDLGGRLDPSSCCALNGLLSRAGERIGLPDAFGDRLPEEGVECVSVGVCGFGMECALVIIGALNVAPLERERR